MSGYSGGESSDPLENLPSIGGDRGNGTTPSPLFGAEMTADLKEDDDSLCPYCHKTFRQVTMQFIVN